MAPDIKILKAFIGIAPQSKIHKEPFTVIISPWTVHVKSNWFTYTVHLYNFVNCDVKSFWNCSWSMSSYLSGVLWGRDAQIRAAQFLGIGATFLFHSAPQPASHIWQICFLTPDSKHGKTASIFHTADPRRKILKNVYIVRLSNLFRTNRTK